MARRGGEEGEASDGDSLEEITAEDFKHDGRGSSRSRVWTAAELMPFQRNYGNALANFAWAQAVQNKPLLYAAPAEPEKSDAVEEEEEEEEEKEEGELEEGEIELGAINETIDDKIKETEASETAEKPQEEDESQIGEFDKRVSLILEDLETVTEDEAKISLETVHARLRKSFESLKQMHSESHLPVLDALVQQAVMGLQTVHAVVISSNLKKNEDLFLRLLMHIKNQYSILLTSEQLKELEEMAQLLVYSNNKGGNVNAIPSQGLVSSGKMGSTLGISGVAGLPNLRIPTITRKAVEFSPLLDLHADHDEGSLPSPTRENAPPPLQMPISFGMGLAVPAQPMMPPVPAQPMPLKTVEDVTFKPYDTDAFKAVSSYQQKYNVNSFSDSNRFPSPTPSEDNDMDDDIQGGEVSSAPVVYNARDVNSASSSQLLGSSYSGAFIASSSGLQNATTRTSSQLVSGPSIAVKIPAKSRDPRIRILTPEVGGTSQNRPLIPNELSVSSPNTRKYRAFEETLLDGNNMKRQRNELADSRDPQSTSGRGGWLEESSGLAPQFGHKNVEVELKKQGNVESVSNRQNPMSNFHGTNGGIGSMASAPVSTSTATTVSMPSLVKGMALNPTMLLQLIQSEHKRIAAESQLKKTDSAPNLTSISNANRYTGTVSAENGATSITSERERALAEKSQLPARSASLNIQNDVGRIRMKPRDPRRILHNSNNIALQSESVKPEPAKIIGNLSSDALSSKDRLIVREQGEQAQTSGLPSHPAPQPDFARLFTTRLNTVANLVSSGSPAANILPSVSQATAQAIPGKINKVDVMTAAATDLNGQKTVSGLPNASQEPNPWGDVDHLLDGYDDQQRADIQRERSRRIDEQNTMFAARKLCLVLDLDHTLLNSAKFVEVDPVHEEILRKKEEIDREKPYRHLFRFPHMGMWTKLRPGVWNFLERASQLFELHLYTMGNKLYATQMAKVLDPTGSLFSGRVISRGDDSDTLDGDERVPKSKDLDGVLGLESAVVIIDDSVRVWPHNKLNLIVVERYTYFPCSRRQFGLPGPSLLEIDHDERPEAGTLASSLAVIERIHNIFYSHRALHDVDVRNILAAEQRKILAGCKIVFSRIFPVGEANPQTHPLWQTAEQFGAVCTNQIDEHVTHVVANSLGTDKVNWALSTGRFVVQPGWVEASALLYRRANELDFAVKI